MSQPFDPNDFLFDDDFNIEDFTSQVDFGDGPAAPSAPEPSGDTGEYTPVGRDEPMPERRQRKHTRKKLPLGMRILKGLIIFLIYFLILVVAAYFLASSGWKWANDLLALNKEEAAYTVTLDETMFTEKETTDDEGNVETYYQADMGAVAEELKENGLIKYKWLFSLFAKFTGKDTGMVPGTYDLDTTMDYSALLRNMSPSTGARATVKVMIPEGYTVKETIALLAEQGVASEEALADAAANYDFDYAFLDDSTLGQSNRLEGYLYPDTYEFYQNGDAATALARMLANFELKITEEMESRMEELGYTLKEVITIASIIEKETDGGDQTGISAVIYNRLENTGAGTQGYLQMDSCIQYILPERKEVLTSEDTAIDSPYNTYLYKGLPAGPICNPGLKAIRAALYPADSDAFYFIAGDDGQTHFFESYDEFINYKNSMTSGG